MSVFVIVLADRPWWNRLASAWAVILGGVFWLGGAGLYNLFAGRCNEVYERFEIHGGLPLPVQCLMDLHLALNVHWTDICIVVGLLVPVLAAAVASTDWRRAFQAAGWFAVFCFLFWYGPLAFLAFSAYLPLVPCIYMVGGR